MPTHIFKYNQIYVILNCNNILPLMFLQINAALVSIDDFFQNLMDLKPLN